MCLPSHADSLLWSADNTKLGLYICMDNRPAAVLGEPEHDPRCGVQFHFFYCNSA